MLTHPDIRLVQQPTVVSIPGGTSCARVLSCCFQCCLCSRLPVHSFTEEHIQRRTFLPHSPKGLPSEYLLIAAFEEISKLVELNYRIKPHKFPLEKLIVDH